MFDEGAAEITAFDAASQRLFFTNADQNTIVVLDMSDPGEPTLITSIDMSIYGDGVNSVAVYNGLVAVAVQANPATDPGTIEFFNAADVSHVATVVAGALPDMVTFSPNGNFVLVANEGEPNDNYDIDPEGSVTVIDITNGAASASTSTATFTAISADSASLVASGLRIFGPGSTFEQDLEPEYISISHDNATAYVALQENNAIAVVDIASATVIEILPLGFKDHSAVGNELDASNRDGMINITNWPVFGMYQPDAITNYTVDGTTYILTANEGDARDYDGFSEEYRIKDFRLNESIFTDTTLQDDENLGRLRTTSTRGMNTETLFFLMEADSAQEVSGGDNRGSAVGEFEYSVANQTLTFTMVFQGLDFNAFNGNDTLTIDDNTDDVTAMHFHNAASGVNGGVAFNILNDADTQVSTDENGLTTVTGEWSEADASFAAYLAEMQAALFEDEISLYVNTHTVGQGGGAIRGQLIADPMFDELYSYGARSFSIWNASTGALIWDSGAEFEEITAEYLPGNFNSTNSENDSFDSRSDDKGPEPEAITVVDFAGTTYAFIALERVGGIMVYDITDPTAPEFITYTNARNFDVTFDEDLNNDPATLEAVIASAPEDITYINSADSPVGIPLAVVANEVTGSVLTYAITTKIDDVLALNPSDDVPVAIQGIVTRAAGRLMRVQDETAGIAVFLPSALGDSVDAGVIAPGDYVWVSGERGAFNGLEQITGPANVIVGSRNNSLPYATPVTLADIANDGQTFENTLVAVTGLTVITDDTEWQAGTTYTINDGTGANVSLRVQTTSTGESQNIIGQPIPTGEFNYVGIVGEFNGTYQLVPSLASDIQTGFTLAVLHNNDGESQLIGIEEDGEEFGGVARFKTLVEETRSMNQTMGRGVLMLSSGDNFLAGPEYTVGENDGIFYDAIAVDEIGYDALSLGNHDFDFGPDLAAEFISIVDAPFLSANLDVSANTNLAALEAAEELAKSTVINVNGQEIGIIGAITPNLPFISSPGDVVVLQDVAAAVQAEVDALEGDGVNKIILISHLQGIEEDSLLATELSGIDIMIAGGGDELLANDGDLLIPGDEIAGAYPLTAMDADGNDVLIVTGPGEYTYLGQLVVDFDMNGVVTAVSDESGPIRVANASLPDGVEADPFLQEAVVDPVIAGLDALANNVIATSEVILDADRNDIRARETNQGNLIADAFLWQANQLAADFGAPNVQVAVANGGGIRNDNEIPAGDITELDTFDMLPFLNFITVVEDIAPDQFKLIMENAVSRIVLDDTLEVQRSGGGTGRFAQVAGFSFKYLPDEEPLSFDETGNIDYPGSRILDLTLDDGTKIIDFGEVVEGAPNVNLATADFTARGGDQYPFYESNALTLLGVTYQQALFNYITTSATEGGLEGLISDNDYPEGGEGRINAYPTLDIIDANKLADGKLVGVEGVITRAAGAIARIQDETAATAIFSFGGEFRDSVEAGAIKPGDFVQVVGEISPFNDLMEIAGDLSFRVVERGVSLPAPATVDVEELTTNGEVYENALVAVPGLTFDTNSTIFEEGTNYTVTDGTASMTLRVQTSSTGESIAIVGETIPTGEFTYIGVVGSFRNDYQLVPSTIADLQTGFTLAILHNNDGESQLVNLGSGSEDFGGVARFKTVVENTRSANQAMSRGVLMLSSGDNFLPSPEFTVGLNDTVLYDAIAVDAIGYDALSLGNHDFDLGPDFAAEFIDNVESVFLSSNIDVSANEALTALEDEGKLGAAAIFEINGDQVGVIGAITPNLPFISTTGNVEVETDVATAVQSQIDALTELGVNKIVLISHLQGVEEDSLLATQLRGLDIMIAGGGDDLLANDGDLLVPGDEAEASYPIFAPDVDGVQIPIVSTAGNYSYLGQLVVEFDENGVVTQILDESGPIRVAGGDNPDAVEPDVFLQEYVVNPVAEGLSELAENVIAVSEVPLQGTSNIVRSRETNTGNIVTDAYLWQTAQIAEQFGAPVPEIAIANGGGIRNGEIPAGNISELNTFDILSFLNFLTVVENITPSQLKLILENAVSRIVLDSEGVPQRQGSGTGRYAQVAGFSFTYNATLDPLAYDEAGDISFEGERVIDVTLDDGTPIVVDGQIADGAPTVNLATADFTARGGDQYPFNETNELTLLGVTYQQTLLNYIVASNEEGGLGGSITAAQYPVNGTGRIALTDELPVNSEVDPSLPGTFALEQNYPNPFNPSTNITFALPNAADVNLTVYNMLGQKVMTLVESKMEAGYHAVKFDASSLASGMYIYRIQAGSFVSTKKMMLIK
ncbi:MAG: choice-of-anchor I family protein [Balneolaceae bacterium]